MAKTAIKQSAMVSMTTVDVEMALSFLEKYSYERQRPLNEHTVHIYRDAIKEGNFTKGSQMHIAYTPDGKGYLINGQHRLWAIIEAQMPLQISLLESQVDSIEEIDRLYYREDANQRRTLTDSIRATSMSANTGLSAHFLKKLAAAVKVIELNGFRDTAGSRGIISADKALKLIGPWMDVAHIYRELVEAMRPCDRNRMTRAAIMAPALAILRDAGTQGYDFWMGVALDDGLKRGDPRKTLLDFIWKAESNKGKSRLTVAFTARAVANAWNAYVEDRELTTIVIPQAQLEAPIDLLKTKFRKPRFDAKDKATPKPRKAVKKNGK